MKIELVSPSAAARIEKDKSVEFIVRVSGAKGVPAAGVKLGWSVMGAPGAIERVITTTDMRGVSRNRLTVSDAAFGESASVVVETSDGQAQSIGVLHKKLSASGLQGFFIPHEGVSQTGGKNSRHSKKDAGNNQLCIVYPPEDSELPVKSETPLWVRYTDANGQPIPNQYIAGTVDNARFGYMQGGTNIPTNIGKTDSQGWLQNTIIPATIWNLPIDQQPMEFPVAIEVNAVNTQDYDINDYVGEKSEGGPGVLRFADATPQFGRWNLVEVSYMSADNTPAKYRTEMFQPSAAHNPLDVTNYKFFKSDLKSDDAGKTYNFLWLDWAPPQTSPWIRAAVRSENAFAMNTFDSAVQEQRVYASVLEGPKSTAIIDVQWQGDVFKNVPAPVQATFKKANGDPIANATIIWNAASNGNAKFQSPTSQTDENGVATNSLTVTGPNQSYSVGIWAESTDPDTTAYVNGAQVGFFYARDNAPKSLDWSIKITPPSEPLTLEQEHSFSVTVTDASNQPVIGVPVTVFASPSDSVIFDPVTPQITDYQGQITFGVTVDGTAPTTVAITARARNPHSGKYDFDCEQYQFGAGTGAGVVISSSDGDTLTLFNAHRLTATYEGSGVTELLWSAGPEQPSPEGNSPAHIFNFFPNPTRPGVATTLTVTGPNTDIDQVTIYARAADKAPEGEGAPIGSKQLAFMAVANPPKSVFGINSPDGNPLAAGEVHLLEATYLVNGQPAPDQTITWQADSLVSLMADETTTVGDGTTTNLVRYDGAGSATANIIAETPDGTMAVKSLMFKQPADINTEGAGWITFVHPPSTMSLGEPHQIVAKYVDGNIQYMPDGTPLRWHAFPDDQISFADAVTYVKGGVSKNTVTGFGSKTFNAVIFVTSFNAATGENDYASHSITFEASTEITIVPEENPPLTLYAPHWLDVSYDGPDAAHITSYMWSVDPDSDPGHTYKFSPNPSSAQQGVSKTQITGIGPNAPTDVTVYARAVGLDDGALHVGTLEGLSFSAGTPAGNFLKLVSVDGNLLLTNDWHIVQAICKTELGAPLPHQPVSWEASGTGVSLMSAGQTLTDENGIATNLIRGLSASSGSVHAYLTNDTSKFDVVPLTFQASVMPLPGEGTMDITAPGIPPLSLEEPQTLNVRYLKSDLTPMPKGTEIRWSAYPLDKLRFGSAITFITDDDGNSSNTVTGLGVADIPTAVITTTSFNHETGGNDHGDLYTSFSYANVPDVGLFGVVLDKAHSNNPGRNQKVNPRNTTQVIKARVQVHGAEGEQQVTFLFNPPDGPPPPVAPEMFNAETYAKLPLNQDGAYVVTTDAGTPPTATVLIGSRQPSLFTLGTKWREGQDKQPAAKLLVATNLGETSQLYTAPTSPAVKDGEMTIPNTSPAQTFKVFLPNPPLEADIPIAILLNDQLVYIGLAGSGFAGTSGIDIAYAAVATDGSDNNLVYVIAGAESSPLTFTATGDPQLSPASGLTRTLAAPVVAGSPTEIGPDDIVSWIDAGSGEFTGGLPVQIQPDANFAIGDTITLYFYVSGDNPLSEESINNIAMVNHQVLPGDPLLKNEPALVYLPQWAAAGYANGTLQIDFKVVKADTQAVLWSNVGPEADETYTLNTVF